MLVLDASAFIATYDPDGPVASVPAVREELEGTAATRFAAMEGRGMRVHAPDRETRQRVEQAAAETGDRAELSAADTDLLAAAVELDGTVATDDYAVQNVATTLGLDVDPVARDSIDDHREWRFQCVGCGREFDEDRDRCPVCGADLTRKNPN